MNIKGQKQYVNYDAWQVFSHCLMLQNYQLIRDVILRLRSFFLTLLGQD